MSGKQGENKKELPTTNLAAVVQVGVEPNAALAGRLKVHFRTLLMMVMVTQNKQQYMC